MDPEVLLDGLDETQRLAVTTAAMPLVVLAPAGSGKTRVLTRRIAYRVATQEADPRHVLALTFTRKAAGELTERLHRLGVRGVTGGTFHAVAWAALRQRWIETRRPAQALTESKARILAQVASDAIGRDRRGSLSALATEIEWAKTQMVTPDTYVAAAAGAARRCGIRPDVVAGAYRSYELHKRDTRLVDFEDILALFARELEQDATYAAAQRWRFRHLFVDEMQDLNPLQFRLLEALRGEHYDICGVGDPQQAIYGWNGADPQLLLRIRDRWPPAEIIQLRRSYRSTPEILETAERVLLAAKQDAHPVESTLPSGLAPTVHPHASGREEAQGVARAVRRAHRPGRPWADQAILVRTHAQIELLAEALREIGIPYRARGATDFLEQGVVRRALRHLRESHDPLGTALLDLELDVDRFARPVDLESADDELARDLLVAERDRDRDALALLLRMGRDYLRLSPIGDARDFASWLSMTVRAEADTAVRQGDAVDVATFHAAKGLEWAIVHLAGVEDGYVPIAHARTPAARAEEARLLYVAMTRAQRELRITWARERTFAGRVVERRRSPLLAPVPDHVPGPAAEPPAPAPPVPDWADELARQRAALRAGQRKASPEVEALRAWREEVARAARVEPAAVLPDHVLARVAALHPTDRAALAAIDGVGAILTDRFGDGLLAALAAAAARPAS